MKKSSLFISALLTAFILAVLAGVFTVSRSFANVPQQEVVQPPTPAVQVTEALPVNISPQDAAQIASQFIGRSDLYTVESTSLNGISAYLVIFSSGDKAYVSPQGQMLSVIIAPAPNINTNTNIPSSSPSLSYSGKYEEHEGDDD